MGIKENSRNSSVELLRIISIICVICLHYNAADIGGGLYYVTAGSANYYWLQFTQCFSICAVNLMIMVSAYFLAGSQERRLIKVVELMVQLILFRLAFYFISVFTGAPFTMDDFIRNLLPKNYYVILYCVLYIVSPYINVLCHSLSKENLRKLVLTSLLLFSIYSFGIDLLERSVNTSQLSSIGMYGSQSGYTIVNFVLVYLIGAYIRLAEPKIPVRGAALGYILCVALVYACSVKGITQVQNYNSPLVILMAAFALIIFTRIELKSKVINELAKAVFTCFLFHTPFLVKIKIPLAVNASLPVLIAHQLGSAIVLFVVSYVVYRVYGLCSGWFFRALAPTVNKIDISVIDK